MSTTQPEFNEQEFVTFKKKILQRTGLDLDSYKSAQMYRRITNLLRRKNMTSFLAYYKILEQDSKALQEFMDYLTINVTEFFRSPERFEELRLRILPALLRSGTGLKVWSAGCSTGAEPYSLAMILHTLAPCQKHQIIATDIDQEMLRRAEKGVYTPAEMKNVSPEQVRKYFTLQDGNYRVNQNIRQLVTFRRHNLLTDPFDRDYDLIVCRNVVIYFTEEAKDKLYAGFYRALKPGGVLFVGGSESIFNHRTIGFENISPFFYRKI